MDDVALVVRHCPGCGQDREFETPPCAEHGHDCPELACVMCGWALVGPFELAAAARAPGAAQPPAAMRTTPTSATVTPASWTGRSRSSSMKRASSAVATG